MQNLQRTDMSNGFNESSVLLADRDYTQLETAKNEASHQDCKEAIERRETSIQISTKVPRLLWSGF